MNTKKPSENNSFLAEVFQHILSISKGECEIEDAHLALLENEEEKMNILAGLKMLHEDLELYKKDYKQKLDADYQMRVLQKKNEELEQFNYMASHDLKEPLRSIVSFSSLLKKDFDTLSKETVQTYLNFISDSGNRMHELIDGLLNFSLAGDKFIKSSVDPNNVIELIINDLKSSLENRKTEFHYSSLPVINADPNSIRLIFQNLISNSLKFSTQNQTLVINIDAVKNDQFYTFSVADNGPGIKEEYHEQVFELLERLQPKSEIEGAGIGLSTCKKLVEMHGGEIWIDPSYDSGVKFKFTIPYEMLYITNKREKQTVSV